MGLEPVPAEPVRFDPAEPPEVDAPQEQEAGLQPAHPIAEEERLAADARPPGGSAQGSGTEAVGRDQRDPEPPEPHGHGGQTPQNAPEHRSHHRRRHVHRERHRHRRGAEGPGRPQQSDGDHDGGRDHDAEGPVCVRDRHARGHHVQRGRRGDAAEVAQHVQPRRFVLRGGVRPGPQPDHAAVGGPRRGRPLHVSGGGPVQVSLQSPRGRQPGNPDAAEHPRGHPGQGRGRQPARGGVGRRLAGEHLPLRRARGRTAPGLRVPLRGAGRRRPRHLQAAGRVRQNPQAGRGRNADPARRRRTRRNAQEAKPIGLGSGPQPAVQGAEAAGGEGVGGQVVHDAGADQGAVVQS
mmetsp:Transcript_1956/g.4517  ORF Transcript_1956/g.4517 Transcript_1956/m.4517 type:complete len:350 (+) Transcript_1956:1535-2584(+)